MISTFCLALLALSLAPPAVAADSSSSRLYELRTYYCEPGRLDALLARFRNHTTRLFEKHGMTNEGYWLPVDNADNKLIYVLSYPGDKAYRDEAWKAFLDDPDWKKAQAESEKDGKIVSRIERVMMHETDFSFPMRVTGPPQERIFELRTYFTYPGKLPGLLARFRDHTTGLFAKQGIINLPYWVPEQADNQLIYLLAYPDQEAGRRMFEGFRADPEWSKARDASEREGKLVEKVESVYLKATDFSPIR